MSVGLDIARDVLANRRSHDICDRGECFYPAVVQLAEAVVEAERQLAAALDREAGLSDALDAIRARGETE